MTSNRSRTHWMSTWPPKSRLRAYTKYAALFGILWHWHSLMRLRFNLDSMRFASRMGAWFVVRWFPACATSITML